MTCNNTPHIGRESHLSRPFKAAARVRIPLGVLPGQLVSGAVALAISAARLDIERTPSSSVWCSVLSLRHRDDGYPSLRLFVR